VAALAFVLNSTNIVLSYTMLHGVFFAVRSGVGIGSHNLLKIGSRLLYGWLRVSETRHSTFIK